MIDYYKNKIVKLSEKTVISSRNPHRYLDAALRRWEEKDGRRIFKFSSVTVQQTGLLVKVMSDSAAYGHDRLDARAIKDGGPSLLIPLCHLINTSLQTGRVPMKWKLSCLSPRLKSREADRMSVSSYRPIAILPSISKLVEKVAQQQLLSFFEETGQINPANHAYRRTLSTTTTLAEISDKLFQGAENKLLSELMTIDQTAAFDVVDHDLLLQKMDRYNVGLEARNWLASYLSFRTQYVRLGKSISNMIPVSKGVPQGSVIGPLLFTMYVNDMSEVVQLRNCPEEVHSDRRSLWMNGCDKCGIITQYADDTTFIISNKYRANNQTSLVRNLDEVSLYLSDNNLQINQSKTSITEVMIAQKRGKTPGLPPSLTVRKDDGTLKSITDSQHTRILGANLENNMLWQSHLETGTKALFPSIRRQLGRLKSLGKLIPMSSRPNLAKGLIGSRFSYLQPLWGGASNNLLRKAQVLLNATARWATGCPRKTRILDLMRTAGFLTIKEQIRLSTLIFIWKTIHFKKPERLRRELIITEDLKLETKEPRQLLTEKSLRWRGVTGWNHLDDNLRQQKSLGTFKRMLRRQILADRPPPNPG